MAFAVLAVGCATQEPIIPPVITSTTAPVSTVPVTTQPATTTTVAPTTTSTVSPAHHVDDPPVIVLEGQCAQWLDEALEVGWPESELETIDYLIWRESRCDPDAFNPDDPRGGSLGLMQINRHWCVPNPSYDIMIGWLQELGVMGQCEDLYDPRVNLQSALLIWHDYGYEPWCLGDCGD